MNDFNKQNRLTTLSLFVLLLFGLRGYTQSFELKNYIPTVAPASPTAFSFTNYGHIPLENNDGSFAYNVPILDENYRDIPISVSLGYRGDGIMIDELGGTLGTKWNLLAGGAVTRVMRGMPDERATQRWYPTQLDINQNHALITEAARATSVDTEQDWFSFNVNGISGSFYLDENLNVISSATNDEKITMEITNTSSSGNYGNLLKFTITDSKGYRYVFGETTNFIEYNMLFRSCYVGPKPSFQSAWFLKEIISPTNARITFEYVNFEMDYLTSIVNNRLYYKSCETDLVGYSLNLDKCLYSTRSSTRVLSKINMGTNSINFTYDPIRLDGGGRKLTQIQLMQKTEVLKSVSLTYDEVKSDQQIQDSDIQGQTSLKYRYFLNQVKFYGAGNVYESDYFFEYYSKEKLPPRFSYSRDKFGYFNNIANYSVFSSTIKEDKNLLPVLNQKGGTAFSTANLEVNPTVSHFGLLSKVIYPTGGYTTIVYEPNKSQKIETNVVTEQQSMVNTLSCSSREAVKSIQFVSDGSMLSYHASAEYDEGPSIPCGVVPDPLHDIITIKVIDLSNNAVIHSSSGKITELLDGEGVMTTSGRTYQVQFVLSSKFNAVYGVADIYYNESISKKKVIFYGGANRVKSLVDVASDGEVHKREFYYNNISNIDSAFTTMDGVYEPLYVDRSNTITYCSSVMREVVNYNISSSNFNQLYAFRNGKVNYSAITEKLSGSGAGINGYIERQYMLILDAPGLTENGPEVLGLPYTNISEANNGKVMSKRVFNNAKVLLKEQLFEYQDFYVDRKRSWVFRKNFDMGMNANTPADNIRSTYSIASYDNIYRHMRLKKSTEKDYYLGGNTSSQLTYEYTGNNHYQVSKKSNVTSDGKTNSEVYQYAKDLLTSGLPLVSLLSEQNRFVPLVIKGYRNTALLFEEKMEFYNLHNLLLLKMWTKKYGIEVNRVDEKINFNYDIYGNPLELKRQEMPNTVYLWGYGGQYPIAEIKNATYAEVEAVLTKATIDNLTSPNVTEATITTAMNKLRTDTRLSKAMVTSYTYQPLVGMKSKTDTRGVTEFYEYDGMQRLKAILDNVKNVTSAMDYHYRPN